jgi:hypothetical protein
MFILELNKSSLFLTFFVDVLHCDTDRRKSTLQIVVDRRPAGEGVQYVTVHGIWIFNLEVSDDRMRDDLICSPQTFQKQGDDTDKKDSEIS